MVDPVKCICCERELTDDEMIAYDDVCEKCMKEWEKENQMLKDEYFRGLF